MKPPLKTHDVKAKFPEITRATFRARGTKRYLEIELAPEAWVQGRYDFFSTIFRKWLKESFPEAYMTSGGGSSATYRLNG